MEKSMNVKTYRGPEMSVLLSKIKEEHGEDVEIVTTKRLRNSEIEIHVALPVEKVIHSPIMYDPSAGIPQGPVELPHLKEMLQRQGIHEHFSRLIERNCGEGHATVDKLAADGISKLLHFDTMLPKTKRAVAFVGATGVGKTTTIAKLAANLKSSFNMKVGLVSADCFRIGAAHHLETYAGLLGLPFRAINAQNGIGEAIYEAVRALGRCDLVLIDTAGYSPRDTERVKILSQGLHNLSWCERILVLPAPSNDIDLRASARTFSQLGCSRVVLSKTDETGFIGPAVNTLLGLGKPLAFLTTGQRVPEDIEPASARRLGWMMTRVIH
jgi:flagellar biosynthesis GTPase FlhF